MPRSLPPLADPSAALRAAQLYAGELHSVPESVRGTLRQVTRVLKSCGIPRAPRGLVELVLAESLNNIVEHAYRGRTDGMITVTVTLKDRLLRLAICDQGHPLPGGDLPSGRAAQLDVPRGDLPEGGFGWHLIRSLARQLDYKRTGTVNQLVITLDLDTLN
ncbi:ATP-binding protein [Puniceibacterium confluentis]|uniref:ATP-binding protein n=1 Tax=Puniceibacterium confluentis TaxID=1958944 RepID=UPI0011B833AE|nr:ATP-binding protein [Puniceibacterium confluentis]